MKHKELPKEDEDEEDGSVTKEDTKSKKDSKDKKRKKLFKRETVEKDPALKFAGAGVTYKAKLFGHEEVPEARGETVCQDAFSKLKLQLKASGEHKQKILLNISMNGIEIRDDKSGELLFHHPVREISFISQDMTDSRAFGYIHGCKESGWRVFAIRTEKNASQVIICIRELFEVVLLKKKEIIEEVKKEAQMSENGSHQDSTSANGKPSTNQETKHEEPAVANLLDLQSEMDSLELGISHMDTSMRAAAANCSLLLHEMTSEPPFDPFRLQSNLGPQMSELPSPFNQTDPNWDPTTPEEEAAAETQPPDKYAVFANIDSVVSIFDRINQQPQEEEESKNRAEEPTEVPSIFADLDPLSHNRPFLSKKDFFTDIKNPPKKILKDLGTTPVSTSPYETVYFQEESLTPPPLLPPKKGGNIRSQNKEEWEIPTRNPFQNPFATEMVQQPARPWSNGTESTPPIPTPLRKTASPPTFIPNGVGSPLKRPPAARSPLSFDEEWSQSQSIRVPPPPPNTGGSPVHRGSIGGGASIVRPRPVGRLSASYVSSVSSTESVESLSGSPQSAGRHTLRDMEDSASLSGGSDISSNGGLPPPPDNSIFIKTSDPFADDPFFTSLSKKVGKPLQPC